MFICFTILLYLERTVSVHAAELDVRRLNCPHPSVPYASTYQNISGGPDDSRWKVKYICDKGYELFGAAVRECDDGRWPDDEDSLPLCGVNVAHHKPAKASSEKGRGYASNAVDGKSSTVHEGKV